MTTFIREEDDHDTRLGMVADATLERLRTITSDPKLRAEFIEDLGRWNDAYAAYVLSCPHVDVSSGELYRQFKRDFVGEAYSIEDARELNRIRSSEKLRAQLKSMSVWDRALARWLRKGDRESYRFVTVVSDERLFVFERPVRESA